MTGITKQLAYVSGFTYGTLYTGAPFKGFHASDALRGLPPKIVELLLAMEGAPAYSTIRGNDIPLNGLELETVLHGKGGEGRFALTCTLFDPAQTWGVKNGPQYQNVPPVRMGLQKALGAFLVYGWKLDHEACMQLWTPEESTPFLPITFGRRGMEMHIAYPSAAEIEAAPALYRQVIQRLEPVWKELPALATEFELTEAMDAFTPFSAEATAARLALRSRVERILEPFRGSLAFLHRRIPGPKAVQRWTL